MEILGLVPLVDVSYFRDEAERALAPSAAITFCGSSKDWLDECEQDTAQLWRLETLWAVSRVHCHEGRRVLQIVAMAGDYDDALVESIEGWAKSVGCAKVYFFGRPGWLRRRPDYRLRQIAMEKEL